MVLTVACCTSLILLAIVLAITLPISNFVAVGPLPQAGRVSVLRTNDQASVGLQDFGDSLQFRLQRPIVDAVAEPQAPIKVAVEVPKLRIDAILIGTAVEADAANSTAWIRGTGPNTISVHTGQVVSELPGEPSVKSIMRRSVVLELQGAEVILEISPKKGGS